MTEKATTISARLIADAVAKAVSADHAKQLTAGSVIADHKLIMGRWFDNATAIKQAETLAQQITSEVHASLTAPLASGGAPDSPGLRPAFLGLGGRIIIGFVMDQPISLGD